MSPSSTSSSGLSAERDASVAGAACGRGDLLDEVGPEVGWEVVAHALEDAQAGIADCAGGGAAGGGADQRVAVAVQDGRRQAQAFELGGAVAGGGDRVQLAGHAGAAVRAVVGGGGQLAEAGLVHRVAGRADRLE